MSQEAKEVSRELVARKWLNIRKEIEDLEKKLAAARKEEKRLEDTYPYVGNLKGIILKKPMTPEEKKEKKEKRDAEKKKKKEESEEKEKKEEKRIEERGTLEEKKALEEKKKAKNAGKPSRSTGSKKRIIEKMARDEAPPAKKNLQLSSSVKI
jgi:colicin import membrane protein